MQATLFTNARLVGWTSEEGQTYSVLVEDGIIKAITPGQERSLRSAQTQGTDVVDLAKGDGSGYWLGPVSQRKQFE
jgi:predicted amidohydrolase YtcJ